MGSKKRLNFRFITNASKKWPHISIWTDIGDSIQLHGLDIGKLIKARKSQNKTQSGIRVSIFKISGFV